MTTNTTAAPTVTVELTQEQFTEVLNATSHCWAQGIFKNREAQTSAREALEKIATKSAADSESIDYSITDASLELFQMFAEDAGNWSGTPLIGGNFEMTPERKGNLSDLKKKNLVITFRSDGCDWLEFTEAGKALAVELNIDLGL